MIRNARPEDFNSILKLNKDNVSFLSPMDHQRLVQLQASASYHRVVESDGQVVAFLLAFREGANYDSTNYLWFAERYPSFLYIDRIVVDQQYRKAGYGQLLYKDIIDFARHQGISMLACEYDIEPPNPASARFHQKFGFTQVGEQLAGGDSKRVSLQALQLD